MFNSICTTAGLCSTISGLVLVCIWSSSGLYSVIQYGLVCLAALSDDWFSFSLCSAVLLDGWSSAGLCSAVLLDGWSSAGLCSAVLYLPYVY